VELCDNLVEGGTTPSAGAVALTVARAGVPVMGMVRPRGGDFLYSDLEFDVMLHDIDVMKGCGVHGVVFGVLTADGRIDDARTRRLIEVARPLSVTFHRAFDVTRDLFESLEVLCDLGADRVLTSVGRAAVVDDLPLLAALVERADGRLTVLPGGGVRPSNVGAVLAVPGISEVHIGAGTRVPSAMTHRVAGVHMGSRYEPDEYVREEADQAAIAAVAALVTEAPRRPLSTPPRG
jgi:copper homeostasis protein